MNPNKAMRKMYDTTNFMSENCNMQNKNSSTEIAEIRENIKNLNENMNACRSILQKLVEQQAETNVMLKRIFDIEKKKHRFPIQNIEELNVLNDEIKGDREKFLKLFKDIIKSNCLRKSLPILFAESLLLNMNFDGRCNKRSFKEYIHISNILFDCFKKDDYVYENFVDDMRKAFKLIKGRYYKTESIKNKTNKKAATDHPGV